MNKNENKNPVPQTELPETETVADTAVQDIEEAATVLESDSKEAAPQKEAKAPQKEKAPKKVRFNTRKLRYGSMATVLTVVVVVALVLVCVIGDVLNSRFPLSLDLTADKTYTFSEKSEQVAALVDRDVEIVVFTKEDTIQNPNTSYEEMDVVLKQFYEFVKKYNSLTNGKVKVTYIDPTNNPAAYSPYEKYELESSDLILMVAGDRYRKVALEDLLEIEESYYSTSITGSNVESVLAANLQFLCRKEITSLAILTGHGEDAYSITAVTEVLEKNGYEVKQHDFTTAAELAKDTKALVIAAPTKDYTDDEIKRLRTWLNNEEQYGRHLIVLLHPTATCENLYDFLKEEYYVEVGQNLVVETKLENVFSGYSIPSYYTYANLMSNDYTSGLTGRLLFPISRQLTALRENNTESAQYVVPLVSFADSAKYFPIASSESTDKDEEIDLIDPEGTAYGALMSVYDSYNNDLQMATKSYVFVSGSSQFLDASFRNVASAQNEQYFMSLANTMLGNKNAITVYTKSFSTETLQYSVVEQLVIGLVVFTIAVPLIMVIICLVVFIKRRHL